MSPVCHRPEHRPSLITSFCQRSNLLEDPTAISHRFNYQMDRTGPTRSNAERRSVKDFLNAPYDRSH